MPFFTKTRFKTLVTHLTSFGISKKTDSVTNNVLQNSSKEDTMEASKKVIEDFLENPFDLVEFNQDFPVILEK